MRLRFQHIGIGLRNLMEDKDKGKDEGKDKGKERM
jgi:hypothetical protein